MYDSAKQWWKLVWAKSGDLIQVFQGKPPAYCDNTAFKVIPIRLVEDCNRKCEWEVSNESWRVVVKNEWQGNGSPDPFVESSAEPKYCPMCGRALQQE